MIRGILIPKDLDGRLLQLLHFGEIDIRILFFNSWSQQKKVTTANQHDANLKLIDIINFEGADYGLNISREKSMTEQHTGLSYDSLRFFAFPSSLIGDLSVESCSPAIFHSRFSSGCGYSISIMSWRSNVQKPGRRRFALALHSVQVNLW